jgi:phage gpG-like protein
MVQVRADTAKVAEALGKLKQNKDLFRKALSLIGEEAVSNIVRNKLSGQVLKVKTGKLKQSIKWGLEGWNKAWVGVGEGTPGSRYGSIHEFGGVIVPRHANALRFRIKDKWVMAKKVTIPRRPYVWPGLQEIFFNGRVLEICNRLIKQDLDKKWK